MPTFPWIFARFFGRNQSPIFFGKQCDWSHRTRSKVLHMAWFTLSVTLIFCPLQATEVLNEQQCAQLDYALQSNRERQRNGYRLSDADLIKDEELQLEKQLRAYCQGTETSQIQLPQFNKVGRLLPNRLKSSFSNLAKKTQHRVPEQSAISELHDQAEQTQRGQQSTQANRVARKNTKSQGEVAAGSNRAGLRGTLLPQAQHRHFLASLLEIRTPYSGEQQQAWLAWYQEPYWCYGVKVTSQIVDCVDKRQKAQAQFERWWQQQNLSDQ